MSKKELGTTLIRISGIICVLISLLAAIFMLIDGKLIGLFNISRIALHIYLFIIGYWSWNVTDTQTRTLFVGGIVGVLLSGVMFIGNILSFVYTPTVWGFMYIISFPMTALFLCGVVLRGKQ